MATYYFCSGFTQQSVTVTANFGSCTDYREYTDEYCHYQTWSRTITFTVSSANHPALNVRFRYYQIYQENDSVTWQGWITATVTIGAGVTNYSYEQDCHEKRYCNFTDGLFPNGPVIQQAL
jgi:hypothetical protein